MTSLRSPRGRNPPLGTRVLLAAGLVALPGCTEPAAISATSTSVDHGDDLGSSTSADTTDTTDTGDTTDHTVARADYLEYCALCHGDEGQGYLSDSASAIRNQLFLTTVDDEFLRSAITRGRTPGSAMSAWGERYGGPLRDAQIDRLVAYLRSWQTEPTVALDPSPIEGDIQNGAQLYRQRCFNCHAEDGVGWPYASLNHPDFLAHVPDAFLYFTIANGREPTPMPIFGTSLADQQLRDVVALIRSWQGPVADPPSRIPEIDLSNVVLNPGGPEPDFGPEDERVPVETLKDELDRGARLVILDARPLSDWLLGRIPGAVSLPFFVASELASKLPGGTWIIVYCNSPVALAEAEAESLRAAGLSQVKVLFLGFRAWLDAGFPTEAGAP